MIAKTVSLHADSVKCAMSNELERMGPRLAMAAGLPGVIVGMVQSFHVIATSPVPPRFADVLPAILSSLVVTTLLLPVVIAVWLLFRKQT